MSIDYNLYIGPIVLAQPKAIKRKYSVNLCPKCEKKKDGNFCDVCGSSITVIENTRTELSPSWKDLEDAFTEANLNSSCFANISEYVRNVDGFEGYEVFISNLKGDAFPIEQHESHSKLLTEERLLEIVHMKKRFSETRKAEIEVLKVLYRDVKIDFAILTYLS